jgi:sugar lactone lactonase YvrE
VGSNVNSVAFSPDGTRIVTGSSDATAKVWDAQSGTELLTLKGHSSTVNSVAFSPDGTRIVTGSSDYTAKVWDAQSGKELLTLKGHSYNVYSVAFSPDGRRIATCSVDAAKVWDAQTGKELLTTLEGQGTSVAFSPDGTRIVTGSYDATAKVWDAQSGKELLTLKGHSSTVNSVAFSTDGTRIVTGSYDYTVKVWDAQRGKELLTLKGHSYYVHSVAFSPDGARIATGSVEAKVWDAQSGKELLTLKAHSYSVNSVAFSPDGKRMVTAGDDDTAKVWEFGGREPSSPLPLASVQPKPLVEQNSQPPMTKPTTLDFASITREHPYVNSLGMKFVPVPGTKVLFSIWETRVKDYKVFAEATKREWPKPTFEQNEEHPAVNVSWEDATAFCEWLTEKEQKAGMITASQRYRLPTDLEWSAAVGLEKEEGETPQARNEAVKGVYPWGTQWPPPLGAGNYDTSLKADNFEWTSPVGSFEANRYGIYDLGGNAWEWCQDRFDGEKKDRVFRGASWGFDLPDALFSSCRVSAAPEGHFDTVGFRCVLSELETVSTKDKRSSLPLEPLSSSAPPNDTGAQKLTKVNVKKYNVSVLLPSDVFPDFETLSTGADILTHNGLILAFYASDKSLRQTFEDHVKGRAAEVNQNIDYKVLKDTWFVVSGMFGPQGQRVGFYTKGVKKGKNVIMMRLHYNEENSPLTDDMLTAMSRSFDGN